VYFTGQKGDYGEIPWDICGHGLGLEIHEMPGLMPTCQRPLEAGMVLAVEVGYLCPEKVGYQLEDVVLVTDDGFRNLTNFDKELV
jgi:Xaa-Pro aminopeptidase